jgi:PAS domain S-box-containing protein
VVASARKQRIAATDGTELVLETNRDITERKRAEVALQSTKAKLESIIGSAMDAVISIDEQQRIVVFNQAAETIFRCTASDAIGSSVNRFVPASLRGIHREHIHRFGTEGVTARSMSSPGILTGIRADGEEFPIEATISQSLSEGQRLFTVILRDITERKRAEDAVRKSEERLSSLVEATSDVVYCMSPDWGEMRHLIGRDFIADTEEPSGTWLKKYIHPDDQQLVIATFNKAIRSKTIFELEHRVLRVDGTLGWTFSRAIPIQDPDGNILEWFGTATDVTERKQAEQALREQAELLDLAHDTILMRSLDGTIRFWNHGAEKMYGYSRQQVIGKTAHGILQTVFPQPLPEIEAALLRNGQWEGELIHTTLDGSRIVVASRWVLQHDKNGEAFVMESNNDITARIQAEQQLRELNQQLEERVRQRTAQLEVSNKELEAFSYSVSHDLRGPLRTMDGFSQALIEDHSATLDETGQHYLTRIRSAARKMGRLIDDLLQLSRLSRAEMRVRPVNLSAIAADVIDELRASDPERNVDVHIEPGLEVAGDAGLLQVALYNLLSNAWKFTSKRDRALIEFGRVNNRPNPAYFVRDNGAGFAMQYATHLFSPFQRLHSEEDFKGSGIGLATVQRIIRRHEGRIWAEAAEGQGATFYFELSSGSTFQQ